MVIIPMSPYSSGESSLANTTPTRKVTPWFDKVSAKDHPTPRIVVSLSEDAIPSKYYCITVLFLMAF